MAEMEATFTEQELESVGITEAVLEGTEAEVAAEWEAEAEAEASPEAAIEAAIEAIEGMEGAEAAPPAARPQPKPARPRPSKGILKALLKVLNLYLNQALKRLLSNAGFRKRLREACKAGPAALVKLLTRPVLVTLPKPFQAALAPLVQRLIRARFKDICRLAGATKAEAEMESYEHEV